MGKRVLVVEDNELNLKLFCDLLRVHGHQPEPVRDGREAHARAAAFAPDLVIMDIQLPHVSGLDLIILLKGDRALKQVPIMAVTAFAGKGDEERIRAAGAESYVSKPISVMRFIGEVNALLAAGEGGDDEIATDAASPDGASPAVLDETLPGEALVADADKPLPDGDEQRPPL